MQEELMAVVTEQVTSQMAILTHAMTALTTSSLLGAALALRPRRKGTPPRSSPVVQTQIVLAVVGALVMIIVGSSLARAFGIVGAANLIRYRAKIEDPKDAVVMLATLSIGLATGVSLYSIAVFSTVFLLVVLGIIESFQAEMLKAFELKIVVPDPAALRPRAEAILRRYRVTYELRSAGAKELVYDAQLPWNIRTDRVSNAILGLDPGNEKEVVWEEKKKK
jgi:hypothetical protein